MTKKFYVLYEHASGYAIIRVQQFEEIAAQLPQVEATMLDPTLFMAACKLVAFSPFTSGLNALENVNAVSEGVLSDDLRLFLTTNIPEKKRAKIILGVVGAKLAQTINEELGISVRTTDVVPEVMRGIRLHFHLIIKGLTATADRQAQLGLSHAYSRSKVKFNVNRADNMVIQSIALLDQLDKDINTFAMRIREWYGYHFPEMFKIVPDIYNYTRVVRFVGDRKTLNADSLTKLNELLLDSAAAQDIIDASRSSIGKDISEMDLQNIQMFCDRVISLYDYRTVLQGYLKEKMGSIAPNLTAIIGEQIGARLISHAGSLVNLSKYPASTIQILGAEKALFRALKTKCPTPKYGLLYHASLVSKATSQNKGKASRNVANKCALASRIDCYSDIPTPCFGNALKDLVETRMKFYESGCVGDKPPLTSEVLEGVVGQAEEERKAAIKKEKKRAKKAAKRQQEQQQEEPKDVEMVETSEKKKKKKKKNPVHEEIVPAMSRMSVEEVR